MSISENASRVPLPMKVWTHRVSWKAAPPDLQECLRNVSAPSLVIEDFRPLAECLEWRLADAHWRSAGVLPFVDNEVPFLINNTGRLSENAATVLFANCLETSSPLEPEILVMEYGAGTGLFARYFLDSFRTLCEQEGHDFYERLCYVVTDRSEATVHHWQERGIFDEHTAHVQPACCDAMASKLPQAGHFRAVFCNYVLDVLPSAVVRRNAADEVDQLYIRTHLTADEAVARFYTNLTLDEIRSLARFSNPEELASLIPLLSLFEYELDFRSADPKRLPYCREALKNQPQLRKVVLNYGALRSIEHTIALLAPDGFILVNDYGTETTDERQLLAGTQRFGSTVALGLNFPLLEEILISRGALVKTATGDDELAVRARLISKQALLRTADAFETRFSAECHGFFQAPVDEARKHASAGRLNEALECYRTSLSRSPRTWELIGEAAEFVSIQLHDYETGIELAHTALQMNPVYSAWLWNVLGDALFCLERYKEAHEAYLQAERVDPKDGRTNLNLAYTYLQFGNNEAALAAISRGLAADVRAVYRDRLLDKQRQVLLAISAKHENEQQRLFRRQQRFAEN